MRPAMFVLWSYSFVASKPSKSRPWPRLKISVFTTKIFLAIHQFPSDFGLAGALCGDLVADQHHRGADLRKNHAEERYATVTGKGYRPRVIDLGGWKYVTCAISCLIFLLAVVFPVFVLLWSSFIPITACPLASSWAK